MKKSKYLQQLPRKPLRKPRRGNRKTLIPVSWSLAKNPLKLAVQAKNTAFYTANALQIVARIYILWSTSTNKRSKKFQEP